MSLYESGTLTREDLEKIRKWNDCKVCGARLNTYLDPTNHKVFIACWDFLRTRHEGIQREATEYEQKGMEALTIETRREEMEKELGTKKTMVLEKYSYGALATQADAMLVLDTIWPDAPKPEKIKAALLCVQYQLNPLMRHVFLIPFNEGKPNETWVTVLGIQANRLIAHRAGDYSYVDNTPRIMTKQEQETIFGETFEDRIWAITKLKDSKGNEAAGYGFWMRGENPYGTNKGNTKANMAFIRSERQAMDRLFAGKMPEQQFEVMDEQFIDTDTGEIVEGEIVDAEALKHSILPTVTPVTQKEAGENEKLALDFTEEISPPLKEQVFSKIAENMGWRNTSGVHTWLVNKCKIPEERIKADPQGCYEEAAKIMGWKD